MGGVRAAKRMMSVAIVMALVAILAGPAPSASATASGNVTFECQANLPAFPSPTPQTGSCDGSAVATFSGLDRSGQPYVVSSAEAPNTFSSSFTYTEPCPPLTGSANGHLWVNVHGFVGPVRVWGWVHIWWQWVRVGAFLVITTNPVAIDSSGPGGGGWVGADGVTPGAAVAALAPLNASPSHVFACPGPALQALITGEIGSTL